MFNRFRYLYLRSFLWLLSNIVKPVLEPLYCVIFDLCRYRGQLVRTLRYQLICFPNVSVPLRSLQLPEAPEGFEQNDWRQKAESDIILAEWRSVRELSDQAKLAQRPLKCSKRRSNRVRRIVGQVIYPK